MLPILLGILLAVVLVLVVIVFGAGMKAKQDEESVPQTESAVSAVQNETSVVSEIPSAEESSAVSEPEETKPLEGTEDFVIFGVDSRENNLGKGTRSDSMMVVHVDHETKSVRLTSIYRDCMMKIEGHDFNKAAHAHSYGGPHLAVQMLNENLDLSLEHYVTVNFITVGDLIDQHRDLVFDQIGLVFQIFLVFLSLRFGALDIFQLSLFLFQQRSFFLRSF